METSDPCTLHLGNVADPNERNGADIHNPVHNPVNAVLCGRHNNPVSADSKVPALACRKPIRCDQIPELLTDITSLMTGKPLSTTGALTKVTN